MMPGMLSADDMARLSAARGPDFDRLFLEFMIKHHDGALVMVKDLFATPGAGQEPDIFAFASDVEADQRMEIDRMSAMLEYREGAAAVRFASARLCGVALAVFGAALVGTAQHQGHGAQGHAPIAGEPAGPDTDPRVGLKAGLRNAGVAIRNLELVTNLPKPAGFFDPKDPAGLPTGPEIPESAKPADKDAKPTPAQEAQIARIVAGLAFANSDLAFSGNHLFVGNFNGFNVYDVANPAKPKLVTSVVCPGGQGDVSVQGTLLVMSVEQTRGRLDCGTQGVEPTVSAERFRGVRVFDIKDVKKPVQVAAVQTCRGSHTHTLVRNPKDPDNLYVYGSGTSSVRSAEELAGCSGLDPKEDPNTALFSIDVIQIPIAAPAKARIVSRPRIFADPSSGSIAGLWAGGAHGPGTQKTSVTNQCHDITVFPEIGLAAGACSGNGILLDISDPVKPVRLDQVVDTNFAYWHSATFNNDGTKVLFTDEWGGGTRPRCRATDLPNWGADAIFEVVDRKLKFAGYYKLPAPQIGAGELRRAQRVARAGARPRHHGAGLVSGRRVGVRLHRRRQAGRDRVLRPRAAERDRAHHGRLLVDLLVQRLHLRHRDRARRSTSCVSSRASSCRRTRSTQRSSSCAATSMPRSSRRSRGRRFRSSPGRISISSRARAASPRSARRR